MAYVRFSSDGFRSDFYIYADVSGGYTVHTAGAKRVGDFPDKPDWPPSGAPKKAWEKFSRIYNVWLDRISAMKMVPIEHPDAGKTFNFASLSQVIAKCEELVEAGFHAPDGLLDRLREERDEEENEHDN